MQLLKKDWGNWKGGDRVAAARAVCRFRCGTSEHPVVEYVGKGNLIKAGGKKCQTCDGDRCTRCKGAGSS